MTFQKLHRHLLRWPALLAVATITLSLASIVSPAHAQDPGQTARLVRDANTAPLSYGVGISWVAPLGKSAVFSRTFVKGGPELWISNGTTKGTVPIRETPLGTEGWYTGVPVPFGTATDPKLAFYRISPTQGENKEVWITDGTDAGTTRVSPAGIDFVNQLTATTSGAFFVGDAGVDLDSLLYFSDGTLEGTRPLNPIVGGSTTRFSHPSILFATGPWCYFRANGNEVWRSDGTDAGTTKLATFPLASNGLFSTWAADSQMFVYIEDYASSTQGLYSCPLEGGPITNIYPSADPASLQVLRATTLGDQLFFVTRSEDGTAHLMTSDGTAASTHEFNILTLEGEQLYEIDFTRWHGSAYCILHIWNEEFGDTTRFLYRIGTDDELIFLASFNSYTEFFAETPWREQEDFLYFHATRLGGATELWQTKGTEATTRKAAGIPARHYLRAEWDQYVTGTGSGIYYAAVGSANTSGLSLWLQRGKSGRATRLTRPEKWTASGVPFFSWYSWPYKSLTYDMVGGQLLSFVSLGNSYADDHELWTMNPDGSRAKSIWKAPAPMTGNDASFGFWGTTPRGSVFYFSDGHGIRRVYHTDGTRRGTRIVSDLSAEGRQGIPTGFAQLGDQVFYSVNSSDAPIVSLWKTDGTPEGTMKIVAADGTTPQPVLYEKMPSFQGSLYFLAYGTGGKFQLWRTDGTPDGTIMLKEWSAGTPTELTATSGKLLFNLKFYQSIVWQSDGTAAGTIPAPGIPAFPPSDDKYHFSDLGDGSVLFQATANSNEYPHWWSHTPAGTHQIPLTITGRHFLRDDWDEYRAVLGDKVVYTAVDNDGFHLWITDGTTAGTHKISSPDITFQSAPRSLTTVGNHVYFTGWDAEHGSELWRTDGTEAGTILIADIDPANAPFGSEPQGFKVMNGKLYFSAYRSDIGQELFVIDLPAE